MKALELGDVRGANNVVKADVLERDLLNRLLKVQVVENFQGVAVDEKFVVALDLGVTALDEALRARLLAPFVAVEAESLDALHLVLPLLADHLQQAFGADVFLLVLPVVWPC